MTPRQRLFAVLAALALFVVIVDLVRRRRLREEYTWLWLMSGALVLLVALWYGLLESLTRLIGAVLPTTTLFLFGGLFLAAICLQFSVKLSELETKVKDLAQELALRTAEQDDGTTDLGP